MAGSDFGKMNYGCCHYRRRCDIRTPCCNLVFQCHLCHDEAIGLASKLGKEHELERRDVTQVICSICYTEQEVARVCSTCGVTMGEYFCEICKYYDDDVTKNQFHCEECGICRVGGRENNFHCETCGCCYAINLRDNHVCSMGFLTKNCPICFEDLFDSIKATHILECSHVLHVDCWREMGERNEYRCPTCKKSMFDMSKTWDVYNREIESHEPMPQAYQHEITILCNDCNNTSSTLFHLVGHSCIHCNSYNTRQIADQ